MPRQKIHAVEGSTLRACNKTLSRLTSHPEARCATVNFRLADHPPIDRQLQLAC